MKKIRYILSVLVVLCLLGSLSLTVFAAEAALIIDGKTISEITISGTADGITSKDNSYQIKATDARSNNQTQIVTRVLTFTNNYPGWVKITYTIDANGTLATGDNCSVEGGVITMQSGSSFTISVASPGTTTSNWSKKSTTCTFAPSEFERELLSPEITFASGSIGTYTVTDADGNPVIVGDKAESTSYTLTAGEAPAGYKFLCFMFTDDATGEKTSFGVNATGAVAFGNLTTAGTVTCVFVPTESALYTVGGIYYAYLDEAISAAGSDGKIVLVGSGKVCGSTGQNEFTIPSDVTLVLPYAAGQEYVQGNSLSSNSYFPYGNYQQTSTKNAASYYTQPCSLISEKYLELTIPDGTIVNNDGIIAVGGTLGGNAAMSGAHSNLVVNGTLNLNSGTSVLSAIGYVYGEGRVVANGTGAKIFQPFSLLRPYSWDWSVGNTGRSMSNSYGMQTWPSDGYNGGNPSPRYSTQAIQCDFQMSSSATMYGYADQYCEKHYMCTVALVGSDSNSVIVLNSGATLSTAYSSTVASSTYGNVGKLTLTISGGATQGGISLSQSGFTLDLTKWPFPVPYNYNIVLIDGTYNLSIDTSLLPGAGLTVGTDAILNISEGKYLAVFTGANDHTKFSGASLDNGWLNVLQGKRDWPTQTTTYGTYAGGRYPASNTLGGPSGGTMMANLVVDGGTLNVEPGAYLGGVVQTTGKNGSTIIMEGVTENKADKDYVFTRQLGLTGNCNDMDAWSFAFAGATVYKFYPQ